MLMIALDLSAQFWIQYVTQPVAQQIDAENRDENRQAGKDRKPWSTVHIAPSLAQHRAPGWNAGRNTETEKTQTGLGDDDNGHRKSSNDSHAGKSVRYDMLHKNIKVLATQGFCSGNKIALLQRQNLTAHHPTVLDP